MKKNNTASDPKENRRSCAVIVTFNQVPDIAKIIEAFKAREIDKLYISDNSNSRTIIDSIADQIPRTFENKVKIVENGRNLGISKALNIAFKLGIDEGFFYFYLLDDDAIISERFFETERRVFEKYEYTGKRVGAVCPVVSNDFSTLNSKLKYFPEVSPVKHFIYSGTLITKDALISVKEYLEVLPQEYSDIELSERLVKGGFEILRINRILTVQEFGKNLESKSLAIKLFKKFLWISHAPMIIFNVSNDIFYNAFYYSPERQLAILKARKVFYQIQLQEDKRGASVIAHFLAYNAVTFILVIRGMFLTAILRDWDYFKTVSRNL